MGVTRSLYSNTLISESSQTVVTLRGLVSNNESCTPPDKAECQDAISIITFDDADLHCQVDGAKIISNSKQEVATQVTLVQSAQSLEFSSRDSCTDTFLRYL